MLNADSEIAGVGKVQGCNMFQYCFNNPVMMTDPNGNWPNWGKMFSGASLFAVGAIALAAVATVITCGAATPLLIAACVVTAAAGSAAIMMGTAEIQESFTGQNTVKQTVFSGNEANYQKARSIVETTAAVGSAVTGVGCAVTKALQNAGKISIKVNINALVSDPSNPMTDIGINYWTKTLSQNGFKGYNTLPNAYGLIEPISVQRGTMMIANGHHRVAVLAKYGIETIKVYLVP